MVNFVSLSWNNVPNFDSSCESFLLWITTFCCWFIRHNVSLDDDKHDVRLLLFFCNVAKVVVKVIAVIFVSLSTVLKLHILVNNFNEKYYFLIGRTIPKAMVDISDQEFACGITYTGVSRVRRLEDIVFKPMYSHNRFASVERFKAFKERVSSIVVLVIYYFITKKSILHTFK